MRGFGIAILLVAVLALAPATSWADWELGANLGVTIHDPSEPGEDNVTFIGAPSGSSVFTSLRPGLRVGASSGARTHEAYLDLGYEHISSGGGSIHSTRLAGNYQYNFPGASVRPYVTAGLGIFNESADFDIGNTGATAMTFGGGAGLGLPVSDGAGRLRFEARYDKMQEGKHLGEVVIPEAGILSFLFGFDLWIH